MIKTFNNGSRYYKSILIVTHIFLSILPQSLENNAEFVLGYDLTADLHD